MPLEEKRRKMKNKNTAFQKCYANVFAIYTVEYAS